MQRPMLGHLDPDLHDILLDVVDMLRRGLPDADGLVLPLHCTGTAGMEAGLANLLEPGDTPIVARARFFGRRIAEIARRYGAERGRGRGRLGRGGPQRAAARGARPRIRDARLLAVVHAETSTGAEHPLPSWPRRCAAATRC